MLTTKLFLGPLRQASSQKEALRACCPNIYMYCASVLFHALPAGSNWVTCVMTY